MSTPPPGPPFGQPPERDPVLAYRPGGSDAQRNSVGRFFLRSLAGIGIGIAMLILGGVITAASRVDSGGLAMFLFFLPLLTAIAVSIVILIRYRRFGYVTGLLLAPLVLVGLVALLLLIICGSSAIHP